MNISDLIKQPTAILGTTGSGKTYAAKGAIESLLEQDARVLIIDPTGAWHGLRAGSDGSESGGFDVLIFGGEHADIPVEPTAETGRAIGLALAEHHVQAIIDTSEMTGGEKNRFLTPLLEHLYAKNRRPLHLVMDEADEVAAQRLADGEQRLFGIVDKIVRRGRIRGFRPVMISQRPAVIHKNVLSQISTMIILNFMSPQDIKAIEDWVRGNADIEQAKETIASLRSLETGEGWVWAPSAKVLERTHFPAIRTFDSSRTPDDDDDVVSFALKPVDAGNLVKALESIAKPAETSSAPTQADQKALKKRYDEGFQAGVQKGMEIGIERVSGQALDALKDVFSKSLKAVPGSKETAQPAVTERREEKPVQVTNDISPSAMKLCDEIISVYPLSISLSAAATRAGLSKKSSAYRRYLQEAKDSGLITVRNGNSYVAANPPAGGADVSTSLERMKEQMPPSLASMLEVFQQSPHGTLSRDLIADRAGISPTSSGLGSGLRQLLDLELIEKFGSEYRLKDGLSQ